MNNGLKLASAMLVMMPFRFVYVSPGDPGWLAAGTYLFAQTAENPAEPEPRRTVADNRLSIGLRIGI